MFRTGLLVLCLRISLTVCEDVSDLDLEYSEVDTRSNDVRLSEKLRIINSVLLKYDRELDRMVPFREIREAIQGLDIMARNYTGSSIQAINSASSLGYRATDNYFRGTDKIVRWCASASRVFKYILKNHRDIPDAKIQRSIKRSLNKGLEALRDSIKTLETVVRQLSEMERTLRPVPDNLNKELKHLQQEHEHAVKSLRRNKMIINTALTAVGMLAAFIISFYLGPVAGGAIGLGIKMALSQIPTAVVEGRMVPSMEEKIKITEAYYLSLIKTVEHASANVTNVRNELDKRLQFVDMNLRSGDAEVDVEGDVRSDKSEATRIIEQLREFMVTLDEMRARHLPLENHFRRRRTISTHQLHQNIKSMMNSKEDSTRYSMKSPQVMDLPQNLYSSLDLMKYAHLSIVS